MPATSRRTFSRAWWAEQADSMRVDEEDCLAREHFVWINSVRRARFSSRRRRTSVSNDLIRIACVEFILQLEVCERGNTERVLCSDGDVFVELIKS
jgi:hypothetical protein